MGRLLKLLAIAADRQKLRVHIQPLSQSDVPSSNVQLLVLWGSLGRMREC
jgi:hypothetical protein